MYAVSTIFGVPCSVVVEHFLWYSVAEKSVQFQLCLPSLHLMNFEFIIVKDLR